MGEAVTQITIPDLKLAYSGKVREVYEHGDYLLVVTTDRISAFDVVLSPGIPDKGAVLNCLSLFWFDKLADVIPNHIVSTQMDRCPEIAAYRDQMRGRAVVVRKLKMLPVEFVVRGYLFGSAWESYQQNGEICGIRLPDGLTQGQRLAEPVLTPATKEESGHDVNISHERAAEILGAEAFEAAKQACLGLFEGAQAYLNDRGLTLCDTKFELGYDADGKLTLGDEALTPDSSRIWLGTHIDKNPKPANRDKQIVRDYLLDLGWDKAPPAPVLPAQIVTQVSDAYRDIFQRIVGEPIAAYVERLYGS